MSVKPKRLPKYIPKIMAEFGVTDYAIENGSNHWKIKIAGRLVGLCRRGEHINTQGNASWEVPDFRKSVRRALREMGRICG